MNHFSYPLTIVQINIFEEPQNTFFQPKSQTPNYRASPPPRIFNYGGPPGHGIIEKSQGFTDVGLYRMASVRACTYLILGSQASARSNIIANTASALTA